MTDATHPGAAASIVLTASPDVAASLGRPGLLTTRTGEPMPVDVEASVRSDVLAQRLAGGPLSLPEDAPVAAAAWLQEAVSPPADGAGIVVISLLAELSDAVHRHRESGLLFQVPDGEPVDPGVERWLVEACDPVGPIDEHATAANLADVVARLGERTRLVVYNLSTFVPDGDDVEAAIAFGDRAQRLDLALAETAAGHPIVVVDADRIVAERGAGDHVTGPGRYSAEVAADISEEAMTQIDALGVLEPLTSELALLVVPRYDRRTTRGSITRWHRHPGDDVAPGDVLFDIEFGGLASHLGATKDVKMQSRVMTLGVVAADAGHLLEVSATTDVEVGERVAVVGTRPGLDPNDVGDLTPHFRVGMRVMER